MKFCPTNPLFFGLSLRWKVEGKRTPLTGHALQAHVSAVGLGNLPDHRQAQTGAALLSPNGVHLVKPLPHPCLLVGAMPIPSSRTVSSASPPWRRRVTQTPPPGFPYLNPLSMRFCSSRAISARSTWAKTGSPSLQGQAILGPGALGTHLPGQGGQIHPFPPSQFRPLVQAGDPGGAGR